MSEKLGFSRFEWDANKNRDNIEKHGIDFEDAATVLLSAHLRLRSRRQGEPRWIALGLLNGREVAVVFTVRSRVCRIISARRARRNEREAYRQAFGGGASQG